MAVRIAGKRIKCNTSEKEVTAAIEKGPGSKFLDEQDVSDKYGLY